MAQRVKIANCWARMQERWSISNTGTEPTSSEVLARLSSAMPDAASTGREAERHISPPESTSSHEARSQQQQQHAQSPPHAAPPLPDSLALQLWILVACQEPAGLRDKPGKRADYYHTCYCLSGLAALQRHSGRVLGDTANNALAETDARLNVAPAKLERARRYFEQLDAAAG
jgi:hypothetical protein